MSRETLEFMAWLIRQQSIPLAADDAREFAARAFAALDEIDQALASLG